MPVRRGAFRGALALGVAAGVLAGAAAARADVIDTFAADGTFADGATLSGTLSIDTTIGAVMASSLRASLPDNLGFTAIQGVAPGWPVAGDTGIELGVAASGYPLLMLGTGTPDLIGYAGGPLDSLTYAPSGYYTAIYDSASQVVALSDGGLAPVPEPGGLFLTACAGLLGLVVIRRRGGVSRLRRGS